MYVVHIFLFLFMFKSKSSQLNIRLNEKWKISKLSMNVGFVLLLGSVILDKTEILNTLISSIDVMCSFLEYEDYTNELWRWQIQNDKVCEIWCYMVRGRSNK